MGYSCKFTMCGCLSYYGLHTAGCRLSSAYPMCVPSADPDSRYYEKLNRYCELGAILLESEVAYRLVRLSGPEDKIFMKNFRPIN